MGAFPWMSLRFSNGVKTVPGRKHVSPPFIQSGAVVRFSPPLCIFKADIAGFLISCSVMRMSTSQQGVILFMLHWFMAHPSQGPSLAINHFSVMLHSGLHASYDCLWKLCSLLQTSDQLIPICVSVMDNGQSLWCIDTGTQICVS